MSRPWLAALRPQQWVKNLAVFLPLLFAGRGLSFPDNLRVFYAFLLFCPAASAVYLINDLADLEGDRQSPLKRSRPLAAGRIAAGQARRVAAVLALLSGAGAFLLDPAFGRLLLAYLALNWSYSHWLKKWVVVDVACLAASFLIRILAGGAVAGVELSRWILLLGTLLAFFLGFGKRRQEPAAPYSVRLVDRIWWVLVPAMLVLYPLYALDERTVRVFGSSRLVWSVPFVYAGIFRYLYLVYRRRCYADPTWILLSDRPLQANLLLWVAVCLAVIYWKG